MIKRKKSWRLRKIEDFIFYLSSKSSVLSRGDTLGELVKCKISKIYHTTKNLCQARHIRPPSRIPDTLAGHVWPPGPTCPASLPYPGLIKHIWLLGRILEAFPGHVRYFPDLCHRSEISDPQVSFQRGWLDLSGFLTPQWLDSLGGYKMPPTPLALLVTHFTLQIL
jgi:hypothetical protein